MEPNILSQLEVNPPSARKSDPITSHEAAKKIKPKSRRSTILRTMLDSGRYGDTSFDIADDLGIDRDSVSPHMKPLLRLNLVYRSGTRKNHKTGNDCDTYFLTPAGRNLANMVPRNKTAQIIHTCICRICGSKTK